MTTGGKASGRYIMIGLQEMNVCQNTFRSARRRDRGCNARFDTTSLEREDRGGGLASPISLGLHIPPAFYSRLAPTRSPPREAGGDIHHMSQPPCGSWPPPPPPATTRGSPSRIGAATCALARGAARATAASIAPSGTPTAAATRSRLSVGASAAATSPAPRGVTAQRSACSHSRRGHAAAIARSRRSLAAARGGAARRPSPRR